MRRTALLTLIALAALAAARPADAGCGCDKPPPPLAQVRPFVAFPEARVTLIDPRLRPGQPYSVQFVARSGGASDWSRGRAKMRRDLADGQQRPHLRLSVPPVPLGPCAIRVYSDAGVLVLSLDDTNFTVAAGPVPLHDFEETVATESYRAGVGADGTVYIPVAVVQVTKGTTFTGGAEGFPLSFTPESVAMYNMQGFLMQVLDPTQPGLFQIVDALPALATPGGATASDVLRYWRHEFRTYKEEHRRLDRFQTDDDPEWHSNGTRHIDHDTIVVAIRGTLADGSTPAPGATPPFRLVISSSSQPLD